MHAYEIAIIVAACAFVVGVVVWRIVRKAHGKGGCDCGDCSQCGGCAKCREKQKKEN